jgi:hypothetical protein
MAAASADPAMRDARRATTAARVLPACAAGSACVLLVSGGAALLMQAGLGQHASAWWMSTLTLATMMCAPLLMSRSSGRYTTLATAATLIVTMSAMNSVPAYLDGLTHGTVLAVLMVATGSALLFYLREPVGAANKPPRRAQRNTEEPVKAARLSAAAALLALFAGLSSGGLARFQLYAICGVSGAQPFWQIALSLTAVCALAFIVDRSRGNRVLMASYGIRAALIGTLAAVDNPTLAPPAAMIFLVLDCLTIPALVNRRCKSNSVLSASCPGVAHHVGMVLGAALSTTPYFFGDGFVVLYALSAAANLICAASLASHWRGKNLFRQKSNPNPLQRHAIPSGERHSNPNPTETKHDDRAQSDSEAAAHHVHQRRIKPQRSGQDLSNLQPGHL